jgi:hypothetical protein
MASDLENKLNEILGEPVEVETPAEPTEQTEVNNSEEGVDTAEPKEQTQSEVKEGETPSDDLEEELKNIDPELKEAILNAAPELRESQIKVFKKMRASIDRKHTELGEAKKLAETTKELFKQYGLDEKKGFDQVKNLIEFEKKLKENPREVVKNLQKMFKIDEEKSGSEEQEIDLDSLTDNERILYNKIKKAEDEAKLAKQEAENFKRLTEKEQQDLILNEIESFRSVTDENGNLKHLYFDDLLPEMERLSTLYPKDNVEKLYNKALRLNDEIQHKIEEEKRSKEKNFLTKRQEEALLKAKTINSQSLKHKSSSAGQVKSLDDKLLEILDAAA